MKYGEVVQDLAARGHNWKFYDENFRFLRQSQPAAFPWINIHWELWMRSQQPIVRKPTATAPPVSPGLGTIVSRKVIVSNLARA